MTKPTFSKSQLTYWRAIRIKLSINCMQTRLSSNPLLGTKFHINNDVLCYDNSDTVSNRGTQRLLNTA